VTDIREHANRIAFAIVKYVRARDVRYADRPRAMEDAYKCLVDELESAFKQEQENSQ
jgi:hypothetical protein